MALDQWLMLTLKLPCEQTFYQIITKLISEAQNLTFMPNGILVLYLLVILYHKNNAYALKTPRVVGPQFV